MTRQAFWIHLAYPYKLRFNCGEDFLKLRWLIKYLLRWYKREEIIDFDIINKHTGWTEQEATDRIWWLNEVDPEMFY